MEIWMLIASYKRSVEERKEVTSRAVPGTRRVNSQRSNKKANVAWAI
jgi:hypothetical protein